MFASFKDKQLKCDCIDPERALERWGPTVTRYLRIRLVELYVAKTALDLPTPPKICKGSSPTKFAIPLTEGYCLILIPNPADTKAINQGSVDWVKVGRIQILGVEECND
jgi:hypothetical protein